MEQNGSPNMQTAQSYPSPSAVAVGEGAGPFFNTQQRLPSPDEARLSGPLSRHNAQLITALSNADGAMSVQHHHHQGGAVRQPNSPGGQYHSVGTELHHDSFVGDQSAPRKRSKVSRACDECRRKKIRCDATTESGADQCSNCRRVGAACMFSRIPMKRGPSKGYIKELADRVISLENSMLPAQANDAQIASIEQSSHSPHGTERFSPPAGPLGALPHDRKRNYSLSNAAPHAPRPLAAGWPVQDSPRQLPHPASAMPSAQSQQPDLNHLQQLRAQLSPNGVNQNFWNSGAAEAGRRASIGHGSEVNDSNHADIFSERDEKSFEWYYEVVHPTFPLLPHSKSRLRSRLAGSPPTLREAFMGALYALARPNLASHAAGSENEGLRKAVDLMGSWQVGTHASRTMSMNLIHLQTMLLMVLNTDRGPAARQGSIGPPQSVWLGAAVGLAYDLRLHKSRLRDRYIEEVDSDEALGRRDWWVLAMLDRWHASSTSTPVHIPDTNLVLDVGDAIVLGEVPFHLARLSCIVGHLAEVIVAADEVMGPASIAGSIISKLLSGEIARFHESVDNVITRLPVVHLAYSHVKLLQKRVVSVAEPYDLLTTAQDIVTCFSSLADTPLSHHFAALAAVTLAELADNAATTESALSSLQTLYEAVEGRRNPTTTHGEAPGGWETAIRELTLRKQQELSSTGSSGSLPEDRGGLQHLANLAVGESVQEEQQPGSNAGSLPSQQQPPQPQAQEANDSGSSAAQEQPQQNGQHHYNLGPSTLTRDGYLTALAQGVLDHQ